MDHLEGYLSSAVHEYFGGYSRFCRQALKNQRRDILLGTLYCCFESETDFTSMIDFKGGKSQRF